MKKSPTKKPTNKKITKPRRTSIRDYQPDENPPDWQASAEVMEKWVNKKLDDIYDLNALQIIENDLISDELREAYNGNIEPLRNKYPELARFLHIAPRETITTDNYYESIAEEMLYEIGYFPQREGKTSEEEPRPIRIKAALRDVEWIKLI